MPGVNNTDLMREYTSRDSESAFAELVQRHINLVYSVALRYVGHSEDARDVTQSVFIILAQKAASLRPSTNLTGWLYETTRFTAMKLLRTKARQHAREQEAYMQSTLNDSDTDSVWRQLAPLLEEAMTRLSEKDRTLLALRFFENKSGAETAAILGIQEWAAHKRVNRAVEKLRLFFIKRGIVLPAATLTAVISANAVQAAPVGLAATISTAVALAGTTIAATATATTIKAIAMTTLQKTVIGTTLAAAIGTGIYEARQASQLREQNQTLQQQQAPLAEQLQQLTRERDEMTSKLAALQDDNERLSRNTSELLKLRREVATLRTVAAQSPKDSTGSVATSWLFRVTQLKQRLEQTPSAKVPELQFLTEQDWLDAVQRELTTEADFRRALSRLRTYAGYKVAGWIGIAMREYSKAHGGEFTMDMSKLKPYFKAPIDDVILQRYEILPGDSLPSVPMPATGDWLVTQRAAVDLEYDDRIAVGPYGAGNGSFQESQLLQTLTPPINAYLAANPGQYPEDPAQLMTYATTPEERAALQEAIKQWKGMPVRERTASIQKILRSISK